MAELVVLIVDSDANAAAQVARSIAALGLRRPLIVDSGESAVLWIGANACDICVLDYRLPGIDGFETLARIRQRRPDLPILMTSNAASEQVAIAAFHAGVLDYVPKSAGYADTVARHVRQLAPSAANYDATASPPLDSATTSRLMTPTYQNRLRALGRQLDLYNYQSVNLLEVEGGFVVRAMAPGSRSPAALEFSDRDFPTIMGGALADRGAGERRRVPHPLLPTGYEDFLRGVGRRLDDQSAEAITLTDLGSFIAVGGVCPSDAYNHVAMTPLQWLLRAEDITFLLDESYRLRAATPKRGLLDRVLGRADDEQR